jgi:hypothetical protein
MREPDTGNFVSVCVDLRYEQRVRRAPFWWMFRDDAGTCEVVTEEKPRYFRDERWPNDLRELPSVCLVRQARQ